MSKGSNLLQDTTQRVLPRMDPTRRSRQLLVCFVLLVLASVLFILNSFPFMFPGYDMWWHMGAIDSAHLSVGGGSGRRYAWHALWNALFAWFPENSFFDRALVVHRSQFLLAAFLVGLSAYWILRSVFHRSSLGTGAILVLAWLATVIWFSMHGTYSQALFGGRESRAVMSWISWYSINYQIALPAALLSSAALLYACAMPLSGWRRSLMFAVGFLSFLVTAVIHAAEVPYVLASVLLLLLLYVRTRRALLVAGAALVLVACGVYLGLSYSYRMPELLGLVMQGDWAGLLHRIEQNGRYLVDHGANRSVTGWNAIYTLAFGMLAVALLLAQRLGSTVAPRPIWFVTLTGLMPLMLLNPWGAGLLASVTYPDLAWRFAFASFLYLGVPIFLGVLALSLPVQRRLWGVSLAGLLMLSGLFAHAKWVDRHSVVLSFAGSLFKSVDADRMRFGLNPSEQQALDNLHTRLIALNIEKPLCTDVFSAYYLFFLKNFHHVYLPGNLNRLPTVEHRKHACRFPRNGGDLVALGIQPPAWRFRFQLL